MKVLRSSLRQASLDTLSALPGGLQTRFSTALRPGRQPAPSEAELQAARAGQFNRLDEAQLQLQSGNIEIVRQLNGVTWLGRIANAGPIGKDVLFRCTDSNSMQNRFNNELFAHKLHRELKLDNGALPLAQRDLVIGGVKRRGYLQELHGESFEEAMRGAARRAYGSASEHSVGKLLAEDPKLQTQLQKTWIERMIMCEWDNHSHNQVLRYTGQGVKIPNIDYNWSLPPAKYAADLVPSFGKPASRVSVLNESLVGQIANRPIDGQVRQSLTDFVAKFDNRLGRLELGAGGQSPESIAGVLGRAQWLAEVGKMPRKECTKPTIQSYLRCA